MEVLPHDPIKKFLQRAKAQEQLRISEKRREKVGSESTLSILRSSAKQTRPFESTSLGETMHQLKPFSIAAGPNVPSSVVTYIAHLSGAIVTIHAAFLRLRR